MMKKVYGDDGLAVAAFTAGLNVFKRDGRLWKTTNVRAGQEMLWTKKTLKLCLNSSEKEPKSLLKTHGIGIRNIRSVDLTYFDRKFGVHKGLCQIFSAHFKTTRIFDYLNKNRVVSINHSPYSPDMASCDFYLFGKLNLAMKGNSWRWCYSKGFDRHTQRHTEGLSKKVIR